MLTDSHWHPDDPKFAADLEVAGRAGADLVFEVDRQGLVHAPTAPGLGARLDLERIKRNTQTVLS